MFSSRRWVLSLVVTALLGVIVAFGPWSGISPLHSSPRPPQHAASSFVAAANDTRESEPPPTTQRRVGNAAVSAAVTTPVASPTDDTSGAVATRVWVLLAAVALFAITMVLLGFAAGYRPRGRGGRRR